MKLPPRISLIGPTGCGKTATGRALAPHLLYDFVDMDELIEEKSGAPVERLIRDRGVAFFRLFESEVLYSLSNREHVVIAAGMGAPINKMNRHFFTDLAHSFYLHLSLNEMLKRLTEKGTSLMGRTMERIGRAYGEWVVVYQEVGEVVETEGLSIHQLSGELMDRVLTLHDE